MTRHVRCRVSTRMHSERECPVISTCVTYRSGVRQQAPRTADCRSWKVETRNIDAAISDFVIGAGPTLDDAAPQNGGFREILKT
mgnify:CR=1 FL=1